MSDFGSSSSELLLDQQDEFRKRKIKELTLAKKSQLKSNGGAAARNCREQALFYATSFLAILAMTAGSSLLFLVPLYVDPAISTLASDFVNEPVTCITSRVDQLAGLANCSWSSCREGCTSDTYHCTHIYVNYNGTENGLNNTENAILLVNIKGCGYPPKISCANFSDRFGNEGTEFPCYPSKLNGTVVLSNYVRDEQIAIIIHFFAIPFVITLATSVALCVMHCDCTCTPTQRRLMRSRRAPQRLSLRPDYYSDGSLSYGFQQTFS